MNIALTPEQFGAAFPFHIVIGTDARGVIALIHQTGSVLGRICPELTPGSPLLESFTIERPVFAQTFAAMAEQRAKLFVLANKNRPLKLRGEMLPHADGRTITFLCSPWVADVSSLRELGLGLDDFPLYDSVADFLHVMQSQTNTVSELRELAERLGERKRALGLANTQLEEALAVLNATLEATADGILVANLEWKMVNFNHRFLELWRIPDGLAQTRDSEAMRNIQLGQVTDPESFMARLRWLYANPEAEGRDLIELRDGRRLERDTKPHLLRGQVIGRVWSYRDVTADWQAQQALKLSEERYRSVAETASDGILTVDEDGKIIFANTAATKIFQRPAEELRTMTISRLMPGASQFHYASAIQTDGFRPDGSGVPLEISIGASSVPPASKGQNRWYTVILRDVTEWRRTLQALGESEGRYRSLVDRLQEAVFQTDANGRWSFLNPAWTSILGYPVTESLGRPLIDFIHPDDRARNAEYLQPLVDRKTESCRYTIRYLHSDASTRWLEVHARLIVNDWGEIAGTAGLLTDVTARLDAESKLERAKEAAEAANRAKTQFLANVSHEIRTPLNAILGMTELLGMTSLSPEQQEYQRTVLASSESLLHLINEILDISKIEAGQIDMDSIEFNPGDLCEAVASMFKARLQDKDVLLFCCASPALPPRVTGDINRIRQILINLLANALKFTSKGHVALNLQWKILQGENVHLLFSVTDTGVGIEAQDLRRVFEKFVQLDSSNARTYSGAGLGLSISKALAEAMGGRIEVSSIPNQGSTFSLEVTLPRSGKLTTQDFKLLDRCQNLPVALVSPPSEQLAANFRTWGLVPVFCTEETEIARFSETGSPVFLFGPRSTALPYGTYSLDLPVLPSKVLNALLSFFGMEATSQSAPLPIHTPEASSAVSPAILVVEDNPENQKLAARHLAAAGYQFDIAPDGPSAIDRASRFVYDIILMDLRMPGMDGFETASRIRALEAKTASPRVPIIALTAHALEEHRTLAFQSGMDDYLTKPYRREQLLNTLELWTEPRPLVLIVDDAPEIQSLVQGVLKNDCRVVSATTPQQALAIFESRNVALVFMDLQLDNDDGLAVAKSMLALPRQVPVPIVAMTGDSGRSLRERCIAAGLSGCLEKPVRRKTLLEAVQHYCGSPKRAVRPSTDAETPIRITVDPELADLVPAFIQSVRDKTSEMAALAESGDLLGVQRLAHQVKGAGGGYGFPQITELGREIMTASKSKDNSATARSVAALESYLATLKWEIGT